MSIWISLFTWYVMTSCTQTVVRHSQNGDLCDGPRSTLDSAGALVNCCQIGVHVARETTTTGHLLAGGRHLTQRLGVRAHVRQYDEHVFLALIRQVLGCGERDSRRNDAFNARKPQQLINTLIRRSKQERKVHGWIRSMAVISPCRTCVVLWAVLIHNTLSAPNVSTVQTNA